MVVSLQCRRHWTLRWRAACCIWLETSSLVDDVTKYSPLGSLSKSVCTLWWTNSLPWKITIFNGKIHYFYGHFQWILCIDFLLHCWLHVEIRDPAQKRLACCGLLQGTLESPMMAEVEYACKIRSKLRVQQKIIASWDNHHMLQKCTANISNNSCQAMKKMSWIHRWNKLELNWPKSILCTLRNGNPRIPGSGFVDPKPPIEPLQHLWSMSCHRCLEMRMSGAQLWCNRRG